jgi:ATP-dependent Zn protease
LSRLAYETYVKGKRLGRPRKPRGCRESYQSACAGPSVGPMRTLSNSRDVATAYHEAGHAVASFCVGARLKKITIIRAGDYSGLCEHAKIIHGKFPECDGSGRMRLAWERRVIVALAGPIAQKLHSPRSFRRYHASSDFPTALLVASHTTGSENEASAWLKWLEIRATDLLEFRWESVKALAEELLQLRTLDGESALRVIQLSEGVQKSHSLTTH